MRKFIFKLCVLFVVLTLCISGAWGADTERIRLGVADFVNRAERTSPEELNQITDAFIRVLSSSTDGIDVTGSKSLHALNAMTAENAASAGRTAGCRYVILGALTKNSTDHSYTYGGFLGATLKTMTETRMMTLDTRVIDVGTGKVVFSASGAGSASFSHDAKKVVSAAYDKETQKKLTQKAVASAASMAAEKICAFLTGEYPTVSSIKADKTSAAKKSGKKNTKNGKDVLGTVKINRGTSAGVQAKTLYRIFYEGEEIFDIGGASLGHEKFNIALAEVKDVRTNFSTAEVTAGLFKNIRDGDKAEQISREEAELIIVRNDFARDRFSELLRKQ